MTLVSSNWALEIFLAIARRRMYSRMYMCIARYMLWPGFSPVSVCLSVRHKPAFYQNRQTHRHRSNAADSLRGTLVFWRQRCYWNSIGMLEVRHQTQYTCNHIHSARNLGLILINASPFRIKFHLSPVNPIRQLRCVCPCTLKLFSVALRRVTHVRDGSRFFVDFRLFSVVSAVLDCVQLAVQHAPWTKRRGQFQASTQNVSFLQDFRPSVPSALEIFWQCAI